jgi:hypothetical protein
MQVQEQHLHSLSLKEKLLLQVYRLEFHLITGLLYFEEVDYRAATIELHL